MPSHLDNQNCGFKTQLHENSVIDLTQNFYPGNPERQVLENNRERHDSNHERQKVKSIEKKKKKKKKTLENESISKHFIGQPLQYNRPKTQTPQNSVRGNATQQKFSIANRTSRTEAKIKQQRNRTNKNSVANDERNYAVNRKVSEVFNEISTNTQPVTGAPFYTAENLRHTT